MMIQVLTIRWKMQVYSQNYIHFFVLSCLYRHYCSPSNVYKFNVVLTFQNLKNVDFVYICFINEFLYLFSQKIFSFQKFSITPLLVSLPSLKNFLYPSAFAHFGEFLYTLNRGRSPIPLNQEASQCNKIVPSFS